MMATRGIFDIHNIEIAKRWSLLRKARENLKCAEDAAGHGWHNSSASRLYYALYQAGVEYLEMLGESCYPEPYWKHPKVGIHVGRRTGGEYGNFLLSVSALRVSADYYRVRVKPVQVAQEFGRAWQFLAFVYQHAIKNGLTP